MWRQCKIAARWGTFIGMLLALISALFFLSCSSPPEPHIFAWMSAQGSSSFMEAARREFDKDTTSCISSGLDGLDYIEQRIYRLRSPVVIMRIPWAVLSVPLLLIVGCVVIPVLLILLCWAVPESSKCSELPEQITHA